jgi:BNR repeat-like domain
MPASFRLAASSFAMSVMALVVSTSVVVAASWQPAVPLTSSGRALMWPGGLATTSNGTVLAAYDASMNSEPYAVFIRRSNDGGQTWSKAKRVSSACSAGGPGISAYGKSVDAVWIETPICDQPDAHRIAYRHSSDGGKTWGDIKTIAVTSAHSFPTVARGSDGTVLVGWTDDAASTIYARTSVNGGTTFGPAVKIAKTTAEAYERLPGVHDGFVRVAIGDGVLYLGYFGDQHGLYIRQSTDHGATWSARTVLSSSTDAYSWWSISAQGTHAVAAFPVFGSVEWTQYRLTSDSGMTWSGPVDLSPATGADSSYPTMILRDGKLLATYRRVVSNGWFAVYFRQGPEGSALSAPVKVAGSNDGDAYPAGAEVSGATTIVGFDLPDINNYYNVYVRSK